MRLLVVSHKPCWPHAAASSGYASSGGFPFQMGALSDLFDATPLAVRVGHTPQHGEIALNGHNLSVVPLTPLRGVNLWRKAHVIVWLIQNLPTLITAVRRADAVHAPIPGDVGT